MKLLILITLSFSAFAQLPLSLGVKGGYVNNTRPGQEIAPFIAGPYLELNLPVIPTIETGVMFTRYRALGDSATVYQVPILLKKRFNAVAIKPFFSGGVTLRNLPAYNEHHPGITLAGGITLGLLPVKIEPEIRHTRWLQSSFTPRSNQTEFLIGVRF